MHEPVLPQTSRPCRPPGPATDARCHDGRREAEPSGPPLSALAPEELLCLVDDLHGRADLLDRLLRLRDEAGKGAICLSGNHEAMLSFLEDPDVARVWLTHGGYETLESYRLLEQGGGDAAELATQLLGGDRGR